MTELKLRQLHRGYILTDFEGNEVGVKDKEQAIEEIRQLLNGGNSETPIEDSSQLQEHAEQQKVKYSRVELQRKVFEKAKEQIELYGKTNGAEIARELGSNNSTINNHLNRMKVELDELIKKWQDERDKKMTVTETRTDAESNTVAGDIKQNE